MSEQAKKAPVGIRGLVHIIYRDYVDKFLRDDEVQCKKEITTLIDAEFALVVKERDDLKKALEEWVEARKRVILIAEIPDWRREKVEYEEAKQSERASFAAAEKLLEEDDA